MRLPKALLLLETWLLLLFSTSTFNDMSDSMRFSTDWELVWPIDDLIKSWTLRLMVCELIRKFWAIGCTESWIDDEIVGIFESTVPSFRLNRLILLLILFLKAFATRSPTALLYEGGGEYFGGASSITFAVGWLDKGTTTGSVMLAVCWHNLLIGRWELDGSVGSIGGLNNSSIRCRIYFNYLLV